MQESNKTIPSDSNCCNCGFGGPGVLSIPLVTTRRTGGIASLFRKSWSLSNPLVSMSTAALLSSAPARGGACGKLSECCSCRFPCLSDLEMRSSWGFKAVLVFLHVVFVGGFVLLDAEGLIRRTRKEPWYTAIYLALLVASLVQYFFISGSSPGYVIDAMIAWNETDATFINTAMILNKGDLLQEMKV